MAGIIHKCEGCEYERVEMAAQSGKPYTRCDAADCPAFISRTRGYCPKKFGVAVAVKNITASPSCKVHGRLKVLMDHWKRD